MSLAATTAPSPSNVERSLGWAHSEALLLSAFLLFQMQLVPAKYFLPWFGGTPAMWTTCMFFFQSLLSRDRHARSVYSPLQAVYQ